MASFRSLFNRGSNHRISHAQGNRVLSLHRSMVFEALEDRQMLSVSLGLGGPQTLVPGALVNVSNASAVAQSEMSVVVNPTSPLNVVGFSHRLGNPITLDIYSSSNGGLTWSTGQINNTNDGFGVAGNRFDPAITFDATGRLYIVYGHRETNQTRLISAISTDGGVSFSQYRTLDLEPDRGTDPGVDKWYVTSGVDPVSGNQAVYAAYVNFANEGPMNNVADDRILVSGTRDGGNTWTAPLTINDGAIAGSAIGSSYASPVVDRLGQLAVSWQDRAGDTVQIDRDLDGLWGATSNFGTDITATTGLTVDRSTLLPPAQPERGINAAPMLEVWDTVGWLFMPVVMQYEGNDTDIWVGKSTNFGEDWAFSRIDDGFGTEFNPWLQIDQSSGVIDVLYFTTEGDVATGNDDVRPRVATSYDAGVTWSKTFLSNQTSNEAAGYSGDYLEYLGLATHDGTLHGLWPSRYPGGGTDLDAFTTRRGVCKQHR